MTEVNDLSKNRMRDEELWEIAKRRASFKYHLGSYLVVIPFLWLIWYLTGSKADGNHIPWPVWPTAGWGVGLLFHYLGAYIFPKENGVEREYEKLTRGKKN